MVGISEVTRTLEAMWIGNHEVPMRSWYNMHTQRYEFHAICLQDKMWVYIFNELFELIEFRDQHKPSIEIFTETVRMANYMTYSIWTDSRPKGNIVE